MSTPWTQEDLENEYKKAKANLAIAIDYLCRIENATDAYAIQQENITINQLCNEALAKLGTDGNASVDSMTKDDHENSLLEQDEAKRRRIRTIDYVCDKNGW